LHRAYPEQFPAEKLQFGRYLFEIHTARIFLSSQLIELTRKEFALALLLFRNLDKPLSRITMIDAIWSNELDVPSRTLDTHISRIRTKLRLRPENGFRLATVYSYGYRLEQIGLLHEEPQE
jgi:DNA-binding response OmpR family regulator